MYKPPTHIIRIFHFYLLFQIVLANTNHTVPNRYNHHRHPSLLIVAYDSFHPDFFNLNLTPFMNEIRQNETSMAYLQSVFPTKSFPNYHSIVTGLYPGAHGVLSNKLYDNELKRMLLDEPDLFHYNPDVRPIWTLNQMAGGHSGCMMWPGCTFEYLNHSCTYVEMCHQNCEKSWMDRVDTVINWLIHPEKPANLVLLHIEATSQPSSSSAFDKFTTKSEIIRNRISELDELTRYIHDQLVEVNLTDHVNVIHLSDHGVVRDIESTNFIDITPWLVAGTYATYQKSPVLQIVPAAERYRFDILQRLERASTEIGHFRVYTHNNVPERWHLQGNQRMGPIMLVAELNYAFRNYSSLPVDGVDTDDYGLYGYDNREPLMHGMFFAKGPNIRSNSTLDPMENVDLYNLFCHLLKLEPDSNNGTLGNIDEFLIESLDDTTWKSPVATIAITILVIGIIIGVSVWIVRCRNRGYFTKASLKSETELRQIVAD